MPIKGDKRRYRNDARTAFWHVGADDHAARPEFSKTTSSLGHLTPGSLGKAKEADRHRKKIFGAKRRKATETVASPRSQAAQEAAEGDATRSAPSSPRTAKKSSHAKG